ncbi:hypothetical protein [Anaerotignum sp.]|uniref:hypothetical protein n=1 Tax=Anaerotignum sp. TaxID=2039241 RepID=UPI0028AC3110|nr:hypothetical protein [Anaerotignum sp.]
MKMEKSTIVNIVAGVLIAIMLIKNLIPVNFEKAADYFDFDKVQTCNVDFFSNETTGKKDTEYYFDFTFDTSSKEYTDLIELLRSTKYRKKFFNAGNPIGYSPTLNPHAILNFYSDEGDMVVLLFGKDFAIGEHMNKTKYSPRGGTDFQEKVIDFIFKNGTLRGKKAL